jgi:pimeloyl-ACP methyl ester carboxylesterase
MPRMVAVYLAVAGLLAAAVGYGIWVGLSHLRFAAYHRGRGTAPAPLGLAGETRYYGRLAWATVVVTWWALRAFGRDGLRRPASEASGPPVLCVHGFFRNGSCMWGIRRALERRGRPTRAVSMGRPFRAIERYVPPLAAALRELTAAFPGQAIDVVAHSMGGVVLRAALADHPDLAAAIGRVVTLGSPHRGTAVVRGAAFAPEHKQLVPGSAFIENLPDFRTLAPQAEVTTVAAARDFIVYPTSTSHLPGTRAVVLAHANHQSLLTDAEVLELVVERLAAGKA